MTTDESTFKCPLWVKVFGKPLKYLDKKYTRHVRNIDEISALTFIGQLTRTSNMDSHKHGKISKAAWLIPDFDPRRMYAGVYSALRFMATLERNGTSNTVILYGNRGADAQLFSKKIKEHFGVSVKVLLFEEDNLPDVDAAFATFWTSAYIVHKYKQANRHIYFVQDYEPEFGPANAQARLAHESYTLPMDFVVHGIGLANFMKSHLGLHQHTLPFCVEKNIYYPPKELQPETPFRVFFYGRPNVDRNDFALGVSSLLKAKSLIPDLEVYCAGENFNPKTYSLNRRWWHNLGMLTRAQAADIYRRCHVTLAFGFTKATPMVALEAMACGSLLVTNPNGYEEWITGNGKTGLSVAPTPDNIAVALREIRHNWSEYQGIARVGQRLAVSWDWDEEATRVIRELQGEE
jgi:glycosyltransferase involved in cell wall biosynthesis